MVSKKAKKVNDRDREVMNDNDRIGRLPYELINHIYSFLDTRFVVQSSILSSRWRHTWKPHPCLNFEINRSANQTNGPKFSNFVHQFLSDRADIAEIPTIDFRSNSISLVLLKEIITYAMLHRTRKLNIRFLGGKQTRRGGFDLSLFRSDFLQDLCLSIDFGVCISPPRIWDLPALTTLNLGRVLFTMHKEGDRKPVDLFSSFTNLKTLILVDCILMNLGTFVIKSIRLENLTMIGLCQACEIAILAPKLSSFTYNGMARLRLLPTDLLSLKTVNFHTIYHRSLRDRAELVEFMINTFHQLSNAKFLSLNSDVLRFLRLYPELRQREPCPFMSLQSLTVVERRPPCLLRIYSDVLTYFLSSSPALRVSIELDPAPPRIRFRGS